MFDHIEVTSIIFRVFCLPNFDNIVCLLIFTREDPSSSNYQRNNIDIWMDNIMKVSIRSKKLIRSAAIYNIEEGSISIFLFPIFFRQHSLFA